MDAGGAIGVGGLGHVRVLHLLGLSMNRIRCAKALPLLGEGQRVTVSYKGKTACGFVTVVGNEPISRYVVTVVTQPWQFDTYQEFVDAMVARLNQPNGPRVWGYVYKRRDELESSVLGRNLRQESPAVQ